MAERRQAEQDQDEAIADRGRGTRSRNQHPTGGKEMAAHLQQRPSHRLRSFTDEEFEKVMAKVLAGE